MARATSVVSVRFEADQDREPTACCLQVVGGPTRSRSRALKTKPSMEEEWRARSHRAANSPTADRSRNREAPGRNRPCPKRAAGRQPHGPSWCPWPRPTQYRPRQSPRPGKHRLPLSIASASCPPAALQDFAQAAIHRAVWWRAQLSTNAGPQSHRSRILGAFLALLARSRFPEPRWPRRIMRSVQPTCLAKRRRALESSSPLTMASRSILPSILAAARS